MKKLLALVLALVMILSLSLAYAEPVTITYAHFSGSGAQEETLKKMIEIFESKNPDIKVDVQITGYEDYFTKLATTVGGGNPPDVFEMNMENFLSYMLRGACADLTGKIDTANYSEGTPGGGELRGQDLRCAHELLHLRAVLQQGPVRPGRRGLSHGRVDLGGRAGCR